MTLRKTASRLASMDAAEFRFRIANETRTQLERASHRLRPARWDRRSLARVLNRSMGALVSAAADAARAGSFDRAHASLQRHFAGRTSVWPVAARRRNAIADTIASQFPHAPARAAIDGLHVLQGRCDLLGYRDLAIGHPPAWHVDPVHQRTAAARFWADVPYLDPAAGDHKVIWEINRHQHWLTLGRAYWLTADARFRDGGIMQLTDWLQHNPPLTGMNWASMLELAFRSLSWAWALEFFVDAPAAHAPREDPWLVDLLVALDAHLAHVSRHLSVYFSPNTHLTGEALALYAVSTALPELRASAARAELGRSVLVKEATRQILKDGGHAERSAHYHRYSTDFYLLALMVARAAGDPAAAAFEDALRAQAAYLRIIADDRGQLPLIGDDDGGQLFTFGSRPADASPTLNAAAAVLNDGALAIGAPGPETCWILGGDRIPPPAPRNFPSGPRLLSASGYFVHRHSTSHLIFDVGAHGFLNGGHAHADALAISATVDGDPVLVDPGTATYTMDPAARDRFRSPRMHNTLTLDEIDFAQPAGPFHWSRVANARVLRYDRTGDVVLVQASHDGYPDRQHVRAVVAVPDTGWLVVDHVTADRPTLAETWWHLHPSWTVSLHHGQCVLQQPDRRTTLAFAGGTLEAVEDPALCVYSPEYGRIEPAPVLLVRRREASPFALAAFVPCHHGLGRVQLQLVETTVEPAPDRLGSAWRLETEHASFDIFVGPRWSEPCVNRRRARNEVEQVCAG